MSKLEKKKKKNKDNEIQIKIQLLIDNLKQYDTDNKKYYYEIKQELDKIKNKFIYLGKPAVPQLVILLKERGRLSKLVVIEALGELCDKRALKSLLDGLEELEIGSFCIEALKKFGPKIILEVIKKIKYRIAHPIKKREKETDYLLDNALSVIGEIKCNESSEFLNNLLDDYVIYLKDTSSIFDGSDLKDMNINFFHLLDCMVRQQDKNAIPFIKKARDLFPKKYVDYQICQIAIDRINKGEVEGYLPMEAVEMALPYDSIMNAFFKKLEYREDNYIDEEDN